MATAVPNLGGVQSSEAGRKAKCLQRMLEERIGSFQKRREKNRESAFRLKLLITSLGALTTLLLGVQIQRAGLATYLKNFALLTSSLVTVMSAWETFFDNRGLWVRYSAARARLLAVKAQLEYMLSSGEDSLQVSSVDNLFAQFEAILEETNTAWLQGRVEKKTQG